MTTKKLLVLVLFVIIATPAYGAKKKSCYDTAESQFELNECAGLKLQEADNELNRVYKEILKRYAGDHLFINSLKSAQRAWISFRDAELGAIFPGIDKRIKYGSAYPMCYANWQTEFTNQRTRQLRRWLVGAEEGDICAGSLLVK
jgi:uncharacterized protein YecT (DUF1311 family)